MRFQGFWRAITAPPMIFPRPFEGNAVRKAEMAKSKLPTKQLQLLLFPFVGGVGSCAVTRENISEVYGANMPEKGNSAHFSIAQQSVLPGLVVELSYRAASQAQVGSRAGAVSSDPSPASATSIRT